MLYIEGIPVYGHDVDVVVLCDDYAGFGRELGSGRVMHTAINNYMSVCLFLANTCGVLTFATYGLSISSFSGVGSKTSSRRSYLLVHSIAIPISVGQVVR